MAKCGLCSKKKGKRYCSPIDKVIWANPFQRVNILQKINLGINQSMRVDRKKLPNTIILLLFLNNQDVRERLRNEKERQKRDY